MSQFFKSKNNQNKYFIYFLIKREKKDNNIKNLNDNDYNFIKTKIIITNNFILHDFNYIINNYDSIINNINYKILEHCILEYNFDDELFKDCKYPPYPYDIFVLNRILLHSFNYIMDNNKYVKDILLKEKINIISNMNYLKRIKDWNNNWKKNRYSIEKYQSSTDNNSESIFSIQTLSQYYFDIEQLENNIFKCKPMLFEKSIFEKTIERPNTDYIEKCNHYFDNDKLIKFI